MIACMLMCYVWGMYLVYKDLLNQSLDSIKFKFSVHTKWHRHTEGKVSHSFLYCDLFFV